MRDKLISMGIDYDKAIELTGEEDILLIVMQTYLEDFNDTYNGIKKSYEEDDFENYTILVHGLKSASRTVGLMELGDLAEKLQDAGQRTDKEFIDAHTDKLLDMYKDACAKLNEVVG
ncbi:MAG: Hpt domain-containing protein [Lachnospiraceae bacterium]|nr:Hpt domain-containing protein [Lachnospiraceae bacterium]